MKISLACLAAAVHAGPAERKVPPRTPPQRLNMLTYFAVDYIVQNLENPTKNNGEQLRHLLQPKRRLEESLKDNLLAIYSKTREDGSGLRRCSFFDPLVPNGGPRPEAEMNKRDAWIWDEYRKVQGSANRGRRDTPDFDEDDPFDVYWNTPESERTAAPRLDLDPARALRQIRTGFQKWILRYISECSGQEDYGLHSRRLMAITDNVFEKMKSIQVYAGVIDFDNANWDKNNFHHDGDKDFNSRPAGQNGDSDEYDSE